jgi:hypothetical protein
MHMIRRLEQLVLYRFRCLEACAQRWRTSHARILLVEGPNGSATTRLTFRLTTLFFPFGLGPTGAHC